MRWERPRKGETEGRAQRQGRCCCVPGGMHPAPSSGHGCVDPNFVCSRASHSPPLPPNPTPLPVKITCRECGPRNLAPMAVRIVGILSGLGSVDGERGPIFGGSREYAKAYPSSVPTPTRTDPVRVCVREGVAAAGMCRSGAANVRLATAALGVPSVFRLRKRAHGMNTKAQGTGDVCMQTRGRLQRVVEGRDTWR